VTHLGELSTIAPSYPQLLRKMPKDYAKKSRPQSRRRAPAKRQLPGWLWLIVGGVLGAFITFLFYLWDVAPSPAAKPEKPRDAKVDAENKTPKPRFDFYKLLQESEVIVPATEPTRTSETGVTAADPVEYVLQVGSFANQADADRLRAQLIMLNLDARLEQVSIRNGEVWHRVMVGPFTDQARLNSARSTLVNNQYNALMLKRDKQ
jgi:cell division septation protein DedD